MNTIFNRVKKIIAGIIMFLLFIIISSAKTNIVHGEGQKRVEIDLTNQKLSAFEGDAKTYEFTVSTGKQWWPTPTGTFKPWIKLRFKTMTGGSKYYGTYYYLPNVPYTIFLFNNSVAKWRGYAIHGTYWHNNFGHPMSHGCINLTISDAEKLYYWIEPEKEGISLNLSEIGSATPVIIYGTTPSY